MLNSQSKYSPLLIKPHKQVTLRSPVQVEWPKKDRQMLIFWLLEEKLSALAVLHWSDAMTKNAW